VGQSLWSLQPGLGIFVKFGSLVHRSDALAFDFVCILSFAAFALLPIRRRMSDVEVHGDINALPPHHPSYLKGTSGNESMNQNCEIRMWNQNIWHVPFISDHQEERLQAFCDTVVSANEHDVFVFQEAFSYHRGFVLPALLGCVIRGLHGLSNALGGEDGASSSRPAKAWHSPSSSSPLSPFNYNPILGHFSPFHRPPSVPKTMRIRSKLGVRVRQLVNWLQYVLLPLLDMLEGRILLLFLILLSAILSLFPLPASMPASSSSLFSPPKASPYLLHHLFNQHAHKDKRKLIQTAQKTWGQAYYAYSTLPFKVTGWSKDKGFYFDWRTMDSGLLILSRFPMVKLGEITFAKSVGIEGWARKGGLIVQIFTKPEHFEEFQSRMTACQSTTSASTSASTSSSPSSSSSSGSFGHQHSLVPGRFTLCTTHLQAFESDAQLIRREQIKELCALVTKTTGHRWRGEEMKVDNVEEKTCLRAQASFHDDASTSSTRASMILSSPPSPSSPSDTAHPLIICGDFNTCSNLFPSEYQYLLTQFSGLLDPLPTDMASQGTCDVDGVRLDYVFCSDGHVDVGDQAQEQFESSAAEVREADLQDGPDLVASAGRVGVSSSKNAKDKQKLGLRVVHRRGLSDHHALEMRFLLRDVAQTQCS